MMIVCPHCRHRASFAEPPFGATLTCTACRKPSVLVAPTPLRMIRRTPRFYAQRRRSASSRQRKAANG